MSQMALLKKYFITIIITIGIIIVVLSIFVIIHAIFRFIFGWIGEIVNNQYNTLAICILSILSWNYYTKINSISRLI